MSDVFADGAVNRAFAVAAFNRTWDLIDTSGRTAAETQEMLHLAHVSRWHWERADGYGAKQESVGDWLLARVYALAGDANSARRYGESSLRAASRGDLGPFFSGYGHEALARAARLAGDSDAMSQHLHEARSLAEQVADADDRKVLEADLDAIA